MQHQTRGYPENFEALEVAGKQRSSGRCHPELPELRQGPSSEAFGFSDFRPTGWMRLVQAPFSRFPTLRTEGKDYPHHFQYHSTVAASIPVFIPRHRLQFCNHTIATR
ncbi:hypothetical protein PAPYR_13347 [Paratrimastix pyriformis]|uniref:Uncharacterized protein n=1 Tax=Paratrimastix pyriformis TaxID=342808 RepID=A0ABQ8U1W4_9EUKA|nr:hypothetical protein PAPYR_13347 [Paratrimastix pyriformis]